MQRRQGRTWRPAIERWRGFRGMTDRHVGACDVDTIRWIASELGVELGPNQSETLGRITESLRRMRVVLESAASIEDVCAPNTLQTLLVSALTRAEVAPRVVEALRSDRASARAPAEPPAAAPPGEPPRR